ncbi:NADP-dependent oxidoreductase [Sphingobium sp. Sx8-8]|uniref:NADP-dependent oxidoreductase n=1 Tax=Sphingobium sp. Sx8-8 TaxID=2933617 RepID=UPI001F59C880|nr:NADP-dependent oxidoreductase [Sphingobium sp. Sx8-8]
MSVNRRFILAARPQGLPRPSDFRLADEPVPAVGEGEFLIRNHYASIDPAIRGWLDAGGNYMPPVPIGDAVRASTVGVVLESRCDMVRAGDWVMGLNKIETHSLGRADGFTHGIDLRAVSSPTAYLSVAGAVGLTAWFGVEDIMRPGPDDTLLISAAAGAVGSLVGQLAKMRGTRVVGIAGGPAKCAKLTDRYGFDAAIDHRGKDVTALAADIAACCPGGVNFVYENVGGVCLDAALLNLADGAQVLLCGLISEYNLEPVGARHLWQLIVRTATMRGYLISQYVHRFPEGVHAMAGLAAQGKLIYDEHVEAGIDNALHALLRLFEGSNEGKMILKLV